MNNPPIDRRAFLGLAGIGGLVMASSLPGCSQFGSSASANPDFLFVQLSDLHWGYDNPKVNPQPRESLMRAVAAVNALPVQPDFVVFTGDLTQTTDDPKLRRTRLREVKDMVAQIEVPKKYFFAGEHDAALDRGEAYLEVFGGALNYSFDHKGVHFIVLDNTSQPAPVLGDAQLDWLRQDLAGRPGKEGPVVVLTHRPLFPLSPSWDWATRDGAAAIDLLSPYRNVTVFYGHVHHENHFMTGHIGHHAATSLMFPLSPVGTAPQKTQLPWDESQPFKGLGWRSVDWQDRAAHLRQRGLA